MEEVKKQVQIGDTVIPLVIQPQDLDADIPEELQEDILSPVGRQRKDVEPLLSQEMSPRQRERKLPFCLNNSIFVNVIHALLITIIHYQIYYISDLRTHKALVQLPNFNDLVQKVAKKSGVMISLGKNHS